MTAGSDKFSVTPDESGNVTIRFYDSNLRPQHDAVFNPLAYYEFAAVVQDAQHAVIKAVRKP